MGTQILPVVVVSEKDVPVLPLIRYEYEVTGVEYDKDGEHEDTCAATIDCVAKTWEAAVALVAAARHALELVTADYDGWAVTSAEVAGVRFDYDMKVDAYVATLTMSYTTQNV